MKKSLDYWTNGQIPGLTCGEEAAYKAGEEAAKAGRKPNLRGIEQRHRPFYMAAYKANKK